MAVELKRELDRMGNVDGHLRRMRLIRQYPSPPITAGIQMPGAMAGSVVDPDVKDYAYTSGFFALELTGKSVHLVPPPDGFVPQNW
jgi:hypothetical protein